MTGQEQISKGTLFIRNIPLECTRDDLEGYFSKYGPVKSCFIVSQGGKSKGYGFVHYALMQDAEKAIQGTKNNSKLRGRTLLIEYALKKRSKEEADKEEEAVLTKPASVPKRTPKEIAKKIKIENSTNPKSYRLIIRNLAFNTTQEHIRQALSEYGTVVEVRIPSAPTGNGFKKNNGFAFIQMSNRAESEKVMNGLNGAELGKRKVAVDWAVPKDRYEKSQKDEKKVQKNTKIEVKQEEAKDEEESEVEEAEDDDETTDLASELEEDDDHEESESETDEDHEDCDEENEDEDEQKENEQDAEPAQRSWQPDSFTCDIKSHDKRSLYLLREGFITAGSHAAKGLSAQELQKRQASLDSRKAQLKNPNYFISKTRLSVRSLPTSVDEKGLKSLVYKGFKEHKVSIKQAKIVRAKDRLDASGHGRSKGYGFLEFKEHSDALACLRYLNNNPNIFGPNKRLMVEFAIENANILQKRDRRNAKHSNRK